MSRPSGEESVFGEEYDVLRGGGTGFDHRLCEAFDLMPLPVGVIGVDGMSWSNGAYQRFTGEPGGAGRRPWPWHPDDVESFRELDREVRRTRRPATATMRLRRTDGEYRWVTVLLAASQTDQGVRVIITVVDVHEWYEAEQRIERLNHLLRVSLESLLDGFGVFVADGDRFPAVFVKSTGTHHSAEVLPIGVGLFDVAPEPLHAWVASWLASLMLTGTRERHLIEYTDSGGTRRVLEIVAAVVEGHVVASWRYVTEQVVAAEALARAEAGLRLAFDSGGAALAFLSPEGTFQRLNPAFGELAGRPVDQLLGTRLDALVNFGRGASDPPLTMAETIDLVNNGGELRIVRPDGECRLVVGHIQPMQDERGQAAYTFVNLVDVTEHRKAENRLAEVAAAVPGIIFVLDTGPPPRFEYLSPGAATLLGIPVEQIVNSSLGLDLVHPEDAQIAERFLVGLEESVTIRVRHPDDRWLWLDVRARAQREGGRLTSLVGVALDVTRLKAVEADLLHRATHDALTGLPNRSLFSDQLERVLGRWRHAPRHHVAVLFCDLDRFKVVNDGLGHGAGDELLVAVAERLAACLRPSDFVARQGGDEFTVLLDQLEAPGEAVDIAERLRRELDRPIVLGGRELRCPVSIGIAFATPVTSTATDLLRHADAALARAKELGRNRIELFDDELRGALLDRLDREVALRAGLDTGEITVHYQPEVDLATGRLVGVEALARWERPGLGTVLPAGFIPLAEETGLIVALGERVVRQALADLARFDASGHRLDLKVNLSPRELLAPDAVDRLLGAVHSSGIDPARVCFEVTESVFVGHADPVVDVLSRLRDAGVRIALDDFGTGYSSLSQLRRLPIDALKIDRSFVEGVADGRIDATIVRTILDLGRALDLQVTAEGVETPDQLRTLVAMGCRRGQGWLFAGALPFEHLAVLLRHSIAEVSPIGE